MRIGFIIYSLGSGGAERVLCELANYLARWHDVFVFTLDNSEPFYQLDNRVHHIPLDIARRPKGWIDRIVLILRRIRKIKRVIENYQIDVVLSFMTQTNILAIAAAKLAGKHIIVAERTVYDFYRFGVQILRNIAYKWANFVVVQTKADAQRYFFLNNVVVIPNPVRWDPTCDCANKELVVLGVGRLTYEKGFDLLIDTFCSIAPRKWKLIIVGDGVEREKLTRQVKNCTKAKIELVGRQKNIFEWFKQASIFVLSSKKEGFPNVLLEAMACGCACIAFDCPYGPAEIIENGVNGILVENQNKKALQKAIERLMADELLRERLAANALGVREKFSIEKIGTMWEELIQKSLS